MTVYSPKGENTGVAVVVAYIRGYLAGLAWLYEPGNKEG